MKCQNKRLSSAFVMQIIIIHMNTSWCYYTMPKRTDYNSSENIENFFRMYSSCKQKECMNHEHFPAGEDVFHRNSKSANPSHMLAIDLSELRSNSKQTPTGSRRKSPVNVLGIDISVLSRNPNSNLPIAHTVFDVISNEEPIPSDNFDPQYDRLPVLKAKQISNYQRQLSESRKGSLLYPFQHLPLNIVTTYHSIVKNKKQAADSTESNDTEKKYTANFILQLLYQLSSKNHRKLIH